MRSGWRAVRLSVAVLVLVLLVIGCSPQPNFGDVFTPDSAWEGEAPGDAQMLSAEEFYRRVKEGELVITLVTDEADQAAARDEAFVADLEQLKDIPDPSPAQQALLEAAEGLTAFEPGGTIEVGDTEVTLLGIGDRVSQAVLTEQLANDADNALADYRMSYDLLPEELRTQATPPEELAGATVDEIQAALATLDDLLATVEDLDRVRYDPASFWQETIGPSQAVPGTDHDTPCALPSGYVANFWFPLRNFLSPVKNQAGRYDCWAMASIGAIESRERVQNGNPVDLSEQFYVNQAKFVWDRNDYNESHSAPLALSRAVAANQRLPDETFWLYNPATGKASSTDGTAADYVGTCTNYLGNCSETAHQSPRFCTTFALNGVPVMFCGFSTMTYTGAGVLASNSRQIWSSGQSFDLNRYRQYMAQGHVIIASFPVYKGFNGAVNGVVSDYAEECSDGAGGATKKCGGHVVQIVGFLSNAVLSTPQFPVNVGGGGYFVVKNSWGCGAGDGGYYYIPADYVEQIFDSMHVLEFDVRRSTAWTQEQANPGSTEAPAIALNAAPVPRRADLRVSVNLGQFFTVTHSVASSVNLRVVSNLSGTVYDGPYTIKFGAFGGPNLPLTFTTPGLHSLTVTASHSGRSAAISFGLDVVNSAPVVDLQPAGNAYIGFPYPLTALASDLNESGNTLLCANMTWTVAAPDVVTGSGCQVQVTFGAEGPRSVTSRTTDTEGSAGSDTATITVEPASANPYPQFETFGVYGQDLLVFNGSPVGCGSVQVGLGATIDLRDEACNLFGAPDTLRYSAAVTVANPTSEALTFDWKLIVSEVGFPDLTIRSLSGDTTGEFLLFAAGNNALEATSDCRVEVKVNAPDPARSKSLTVWTGRCTYWTTRLN